MNNSLPIITILKALISLILSFFNRGILAMFVLTLAAPIFIIASALEDSGHDGATYVIIKVLLFPSAIQGKQFFEFPDLLLAFVVWSVLFGALSVCFTFFTKGRYKSFNSNKALHMIYLVTYGIGLCCVPFLNLAEGAKVSDIFIVMIIFFVLGYIALGLLVALKTFRKRLNGFLA